MDTKSIIELINRLVSLAGSGTYQCDTDGARKITQLIDVANATIKVLAVEIEEEDEAEVKTNE